MDICSAAQQQKLGRVSSDDQTGGRTKNTDRATDRRRGARGVAIEFESVAMLQLQCIAERARSRHRAARTVTTDGPIDDSRFHFY